MIPSPFGWALEDLPHGIALVHPRGPAVASIVYRDRARPLRRVGMLVREHLAAVPQFEVQRIGAPERLLTREGEHAALVTIAGTQGGQPAQRDLGFVLADDHYSVLGALCLEPARFSEITELVRALTREDTQVLGMRRRRFEYTPPPGWQPLARSLATEWLAPDYPRDATWLMVYPANPLLLVTTSVQALAAVLAHAGHHLEVVQAPQPIAVGTLHGEHQIVQATRADSAAMLREIIVLQDARFSYAFELSSHTPECWDSAREILRALLDSVRPVPGPARHEPESPALSHWTE